MCAHTNTCTSTHTYAHTYKLVCCVAWMGWDSISVAFFTRYNFGVCVSFVYSFYLYRSLFSFCLLFSVFHSTSLLLLFYFVDLSIYLCIIFHSAAPEFKVANVDGYLYVCMYLCIDGCVRLYTVALFCLISFSFLCFFFIGNFLASHRIEILIYRHVSVLEAEWMGVRESFPMAE